MKRVVEARSVEASVQIQAGVDRRDRDQSTQVRNDPMRRFVATPYSVSLPVMGRTVRLETNSSKLLTHMVELFSCYPQGPDGRPVFLWRIVVEFDGNASEPWPPRWAFSDDGLRWAQFGKQNFLAVDLEVREAIAFVSEKLIEDELGFTSPFLDNLLCLTVGSLGLVPVWANCVAREHRGVLLLGEPNSGKTSASYLAKKLGLEFYADEGVFLELESNVLRGWSGFWPPTFRPEALEFLSELRERTSPCFHRNFVVHHLTRDARSSSRSPVQPVCCLFLERQSSASRGPSPIARDDLARLLAGSVLFQDDELFIEQQTRVLHALEVLPAYVLHYGNDSAVAAAVARDLLAVDDHTEPNRELLTAKNMGTSPLPSAQI
jgi:hypothetical protein